MQPDADMLRGLARDLGLDLPEDALAELQLQLGEVLAWAEALPPAVPDPGPPAPWTGAEDAP